MLGNIKKSLDERGVTLVELMVVISIASIVLVAVTSISIYIYGDTLRGSIRARLGGESQNILRSVTEELRQSSSIRTTNANPDANAPGGAWTTSNTNLILIISTPALDASNNFIMNNQTGFPYQNEIVYFVNDGTLYKRYIANQNAVGNKTRSSCPASKSSSICAADVVMTKYFKAMDFVLYDQNNDVTTNIPAARSILLKIDLERKISGQPVTFNNSIRITIRNNAS